jgi:FkbM family methyltransferase
MSNWAERIKTVLRNPKIGTEFAHYCVQKLYQKEVTRKLRGVSLSGFNGFSEYHSVAGGMTDNELSFIKNHPLGAGVVIDVGANLGYFSLLLANRNPNRQIYAIEPGPSTFRSLQLNIDLNRASQVLCFQNAIASHDGIVQFASRENARANASISGAILHENDTVSVPCLTLDTFCEQNVIDEVSLLKVDVEGYETLIFRGATHVLKSVRPRLIYFEVCPALTQLAGFDANEPAGILVDYGYKLSRIGELGRLESVDVDESIKVTGVENWVAVLPR